MATSIAPQNLTIEFTTRLSDLEMAVTAARALGNISASLEPQDMLDFSHVTQVVTEHAYQCYHDFHAFYSERVYPLLGGVK